MKRVAGINNWESNHAACEIVGINTFRHLQAKRMLNYFFGILQSGNVFIANMRYYFKFCSYVKCSIEKYFWEHYQINRLTSQPKCAVFARIDFIERHGPHSSYNPS